jgi:hypothetical protein
VQEQSFVIPQSKKNPVWCWFLRFFML